MTTRRRVLAAVPGVLALTSGCTELLGEAKTFEAKPVETEASVASDAGYEFNGVEDRTVEREFASQTVRVVNKVATYEKSLSIPLVGSARLGVFAAISTPAIELAGKTFNPVGDYDNDRLVGMLQSNYEGISDVREDSSQTVAVLGTDTTVTKYIGKAAFSGQQIDVDIHVSKVRDGADFVVCFGVSPTQLNEQENVLSMMSAAIHPA
ncbi:hypothetical protein SAMN04487948_106119 [Halogranum amylolyticum]|uniref:Lipoprotein n=1 Tax=Halogranum amylolyticum TaxID=660520 RepID=A0A1H8TB98_9EURY|nr:DUF6517 family protein [Halogranum amylolyticum]SEO87753.1 hypothetical protein SAMN04487948_106119 [Halogranum amylolyticum]